MKAQGLPLNFIILGALALLVLVVAVAFFMSGTSSLTSGLTQQQLNQKCTSLCGNIDALTRISSNTSSNCNDDTPQGCFTLRAAELATEYVTDSYEIPGLGEVTCEDAVPCQVRFADLTSCVITENNGEGSCE